MEKIFISWGSGDEEAVKHISKRLKKIGFDLYEYSDSMLPGDKILATIEDIIERSEIAIVCLSDDACKRPWVITEITLLYQAKQRGNLKEIIPIQVGRLDHTNLPPAMGEGIQNILDSSELSIFENGSDKLIRAIYKNLYGQEPVILPAVLLAMNADEFSSISPDLEKKTSDLQMCGYLGMGNQADIIKFLETRYGARDENFSPFSKNFSLIKSMQKVTDRLNKQRSTENSKPVFVQWLNTEIFSDDNKTRNWARDFLRKNKSLIIIDSLSIHHQRLRDQFSNILFENSAILWVPPYTQWTGELVSKTSEVIQNIDRLHDYFRDWMGESDDVSKLTDSMLVNYEFGLFTQPNLSHWLYRILEESTIIKPQQSLVNSMNAMNANPSMNPRNFR